MLPSPLQQNRTNFRISETALWGNLQSSLVDLLVGLRSQGSCILLAFLQSTSVAFTELFHLCVYDKLLKHQRKSRDVPLKWHIRFHQYLWITSNILSIVHHQLCTRLPFKKILIASRHSQIPHTSMGSDHINSCLQVIGSALSGIPIAENSFPDIQPFPVEGDRTVLSTLLLATIASPQQGALGGTLQRCCGHHSCVIGTPKQTCDPYFGPRPGVGPLSFHKSPVSKLPRNEEYRALLIPSVQSSQGQFLEPMDFSSIT